MMGMIQYLGRYVSNLSDRMKPMNELLAKNAQWTWDTVQRECLNDLKRMITTAPVLTYFNLNGESVVRADASSMEGCIYQKHSVHVP